MSNVEQFEKAVTEAGAEAMRITRGPRGAERLVIQTRGGLITREVPLRGDLGRDIQAAATSAQEIVASAKRLTAAPARTLSASAITAMQTESRCRAPAARGVGPDNDALGTTTPGAASTSSSKARRSGNGLARVTVLPAPHAALGCPVAVRLDTRAAHHSNGPDTPADNILVA